MFEPFIATFSSPKSAPKVDDSLRTDHEERMLTEYDVIPLLRRLCVDLGFCFSANVADKFETNPPRTIETFWRLIVRQHACALHLR
jgi:hypothetical protein